MRVQGGRDVTFANGQQDESGWLGLVTADGNEIQVPTPFSLLAKDYPSRKRSTRVKLFIYNDIQNSLVWQLDCLIDEHVPAESYKSDQEISG